MVYKNLYIIGNGFDIHHGIKCGFGDFKEWLKKNDIVFLKNLTQVYENAWENNWWKDFEKDAPFSGLKCRRNELTDE